VVTVRMSGLIRAAIRQVPFERKGLGVSPGPFPAFCLP
jgi:hypothetical protein